jgi:hypothetical protein
MGVSHYVNEVSQRGSPNLSQLSTLAQTLFGRAVCAILMKLVQGMHVMQARNNRASVFSWQVWSPPPSTNEALPTSSALTETVSDGASVWPGFGVARGSPSFFSLTL